MRKTLIIWSFTLPAILALIIVGSAIYLWVIGAPVPDALLQIANIAIGWVFGFLPGLVKEALDAKETTP